MSNALSLLYNFGPSLTPSFEYAAPNFSSVLGVVMPPSEMCRMGLIEADAKLKRVASAQTQGNVVLNFSQRPKLHVGKDFIAGQNRSRTWKDATLGSTIQSCGIRVAYGRHLESLRCQRAHMSTSTP